jgi:hypothetical protein
VATRFSDMEWWAVNEADLAVTDENEVDLHAADLHEADMHRTCMERQGSLSEENRCQRHASIYYIN